MFNRLLNRLSRHDRAKGFSLIELLLVVALIGIISAVAIPSFMGQKKRARIVGDATSNVKVIQNSLEARRADMGAYGIPDDYEYKASGTRPGVGKDIVPSFHPQGNSKMDYKITIGTTGLTYEITVTDPLKPGQHVLVADQTGGVTVNKKY